MLRFTFPRARGWAGTLLGGAPASTHPAARARHRRSWGAGGRRGGPAAVPVRRNCSAGGLVRCSCSAAFPGPRLLFPRFSTPSKKFSTNSRKGLDKLSRLCYSIIAQYRRYTLQPSDRERPAPTLRASLAVGMWKKLEGWRLLTFRLFFVPAVLHGREQVEQPGALPRLRCLRAGRSPPSAPPLGRVWRGGGVDDRGSSPAPPGARVLLD